MFRSEINKIPKAFSPVFRNVSVDAQKKASGKLLSKNVLNTMNTRFNYNLENVRIHDSSEAADSAEQLNANAYTIDNHIFFNKGKYQPDTKKGLKLLSHELAHVVQNSRYENTNRTENRADNAAEKVIDGGNVSPTELGGSTQRFHRQEKEKKETVKPKQQKEEKTTIPLDKLLKPPPEKPKKEKTPQLPSRIPIPPLSTGNFSLGLRLGFPKLPENKLKLSVPDSFKESMERAKIMNQILTGKVPTGWEATDKAKLAQAVWGIFSEKISPSLAKKLTSGLTVSSPSSGLSYELDLVLITDFKKDIGGGLSFTIKW